MVDALDLQKLLSQCMLIDVPRFKRQWQRIQGITDKNQQLQRTQQLKQQIQDSIFQRDLRTQNVPPLQYGDLPILNYKTEIIERLQQNNVIIVAGETGSGKSTQLPKICLEAGFGRAGLIGHTQPRRIAAKSIAARIADEMDSILGDYVGYEIRFEKKIKPQSYIKLMTDGILLQELSHNKWLNQYDCIIIDEAHERSLNIDFLLGFLKRLLQKRKDLKVIITSATIELATFAEYFNAPVISVEGRSYGVEVNYLGQDFTLATDDPTLQVTQTVELAMKRGPGDILIFQSGEKEIHEVAEVLSNEQHHAIDILPLYAKLNAKAQQKIFQSAKRRKVIIATNIAETALTVPHIRYVIDNGLARISRYNYRTKMQRLNIEAVSQASCEQRKGRCGRVGPGICYRLYSEEDYLLRDPYTTPEILRTDLSSVLLKMLSLNIEDIEAFGFISPPDIRYINDGLALLERLQAVEHNQLTPLGRQLARFPIAPRLSRILVTSQKYSALKECLIIVSFLSIEDIRERPHDEKEKANQAHLVFANLESDFMTILNLWNFLFVHKQKLSHNQFRKACLQNYFSYLRVCEWFDVHEQLQDMARGEKLKMNQVAADYASIHKALLSGLIDTIGLKDEKKEYLGPRNMKFIIHPSSSLYAKPPQWLVSFAVVHTTKNYARMNARILPEWLEEMAGHLIKKQYEAPEFDVKSQSVVAIEKSLLFGLLIGQRKVSYEKIDPLVARKIFIQSALCEQLLNTNLKFYQLNKKTIAEVIALEDRIRRKQLLYDENNVFNFYEARLPSNIASKRTLEAWAKIEGDKQLLFEPAAIYASVPDSDLLADFPSTIKIKGVTLDLEYKFDLAATDDGVTVIVPQNILPYLLDMDFPFPVPGLSAEKITFYFKNLPKSIRNSLSPLNMHIQEVVQTYRDKQSIEEAVIDYVNRTLRMSISKDVFKTMVLPAYLITHFKVIGKHNQILGEGDSLPELVHELGKGLFNGPAQVQLEKKNIESWNFGDLPVEVASSTSQELKLYPALVTTPNGLEIQLFHTKAMADLHHTEGLIQCYTLYMHDAIKYVSKTVKTQKKTITKFYPFGDSQQLLDDLAYMIVDAIFVEHHEFVRTQAAFLARLAANKAAFTLSLTQSIPLILNVLQLFPTVQETLNKKTNLNEGVKQEIQNQLAGLFPKDFVKTTPYFWLKRYPIYLKAILERIDKYPRAPDKDKQNARDIQEIEKIYLSKLSAADMRLRSKRDPLALFKWKIEEYRVSLFAQTLGTIESVSKVRLLKILKEIG